MPTQIKADPYPEEVYFLYGEPGLPPPDPSGVPSERPPPVPPDDFEEPMLELW